MWRCARQLTEMFCVAIALTLPALYSTVTSTGLDACTSAIMPWTWAMICGWVQRVSGEGTCQRKQPSERFSGTFLVQSIFGIFRVKQSSNPRGGRVFFIRFSFPSFPHPAMLSSDEGCMAHYVNERADIAYPMWNGSQGESTFMSEGVVNRSQPLKTSWDHHASNAHFTMHTAGH